MSHLNLDRLDSLPPLRDVIAAHGLQAKKSLGQNFLLDQNITDKIVRLAGDLKDKTVIEIGPGPGGLTRSLLRMPINKLIAIEFDPRAIQALQDLKNALGDRLEIVQGDALEISLTMLCSGPRAVVANLPYNIATPLMMRWFKDIYDDHTAYESLTLMVQKEVAQRLASVPSNKSYGRLSVMAQWLCDVKKLYDVPPSAFTPPPKVTSSIVQFTPKKAHNKDIDFMLFEKLTELAFGQRRKMLRSSLRVYVDILDELKIDSTLRAENLSVQQFADIARHISKKTA